MFDNLQLTLATIFSKIALLAPSDTNSETGGDIDGESVKSDHRKVPVKVGEKNSLKGLKDWKLNKHGL
jgi:hypothetical protein